MKIYELLTKEEIKEVENHRKQYRNHMKKVVKYVEGEKVNDVKSTKKS